jgi:ATP-dependent helicase/DNAse subunit B
MHAETSPTVLVEYLAAAKLHVGGTLWLSPTVRAASEVRLRLAKSGRPLLCPNVFTFELFATALLERAGALAPSAVPLRLVIEETTKQLVRGRKVEHYRRVIDTGGFIAGVQGLVQELDVAGVPPEQFAELSRRMESPKLTACAELYAAVNRHWNWARNPVGEAAGLIKGTLPPPFNSVQQVFLEGFVTFSPVEWRLLEALTSVASLKVCLPATDPKREEVFAAVSDMKARLAAMSVRVLPVTPNSAVSRPVGLAHLDRHLFANSMIQSQDAAGVSLIEAPGEVGEARLVARRIRRLILEGTRPDEIIVTARELSNSLDLLEEVFAEYGLPVESDADRSIGRNPAIATLLRAVRLADEGFPFAAMTALLRSTYFNPAWPEGDAEIVHKAERLLRLLGLTRDREAYLRAVNVWSESPPDGLEDEEADQPRRLQKALLAADCRPFLERFFRSWDGLPARAEPAAFVSWLRDFAHHIGLSIRVQTIAEDQAALTALFAAFERQTGQELSRAEFFGLLSNVSAAERMPRAEPTAGRIRVLPADEARHLDCDFLFVSGLGEGSFPRLGSPTSLLDDGDRVALRNAGSPLDDPGTRLGNDQLLFLQLISRARRGVVLSYPASDAGGQPLLPGSFLRSVYDCFSPGTIASEHQRMLVQGYATRRAFSPAEARVQFAVKMGDANSAADWRHTALDATSCEHLRWANEVARSRFDAKEYNPFDGALESPLALEEVNRRFGPQRVFSPKSLEAYVACPFRFLLGHVLRLEELEEPSEEVEQTRRGAAYHRALARLHRAIEPDMLRTTLPEQIDGDLLTQLDEAVREYAERAPSPSAKKLWELEGRRLRRSAAKYRGHWDEFLEPWRDRGTVLTPQLLEADFGLRSGGRPIQSPASGDLVAPLTIQVGDVEIRIGGRIDRVDVADLRGELGFWIIDYKTGRSVHYTGSEISRLEKLQLSLYALAVERVFFPGRAARPLGLAYWLVMYDGPKTVTPGSRSALAWLTDPEKWAKFREQLEHWVAAVVSKIRDGRFPLAPRSENCTDTCSFGQVCRISQSRNVGKVWDLLLPGGE